MSDAAKRDRSEDSDAAQIAKKPKLGDTHDGDTTAKRPAEEALADGHPDAKRSRTSAPEPQGAASNAAGSAHEPRDEHMSPQDSSRRDSHSGAGFHDREWYSDENTVFVKGLAHDVTEDTLNGHFKGCGNILGVRLARNPEGKIRGFAYVQFDTEQAMLEAIKLNKSKVLGKQVFVAKSDPPPKHKGGRGGERGGRAGGGGGRGGGRGGPASPKQDAPAPSPGPLRLLGMPRAVAVRTAGARKPTPSVAPATTPQNGS